MAKHKVLSTKKLDPSLIEQAKQNDIEILEQEFISINLIWSQDKYREIAAHFDVEYVAFTSSNAVIAVKNHLVAERLPWKIFSLSGKTRTELLDAKYFSGNKIIHAENASALAEKIIQEGASEIVFFCGDKRREELPWQLKRASIKVTEVIVYTTEETPKKIDEEFDAVLFFSPSAVRSFFSLNKLNHNVVCFVVGQTTADSVENYCGNEIIVSESPSQKMMLAAVDLYFKQHKKA
jgi:uroporphyrinogen-III synthase